MCECICYIRTTPTRGLVLKPTGNWNHKDINLKFKICIHLDWNYETDPESRRSMTSTVVYFNDAPIVFSSVTQKHVMLSVTEAELLAIETKVQDMMYIYRVIMSMELQVELPLADEMENSGGMISQMAGVLAGGSET